MLRFAGLFNDIGLSPTLFYTPTSSKDFSMSIKKAGLFTGSILFAALAAGCAKQAAPAAAPATAAPAEAPSCQGPAWITQRYEGVDMADNICDSVRVQVVNVGDSTNEEREALDVATANIAAQYKVKVRGVHDRGVDIIRGAGGDNVNVTDVENIDRIIVEEDITGAKVLNSISVRKKGDCWVEDAFEGNYVAVRVCLSIDSNATLQRIHDSIKQTNAALESHHDRLDRKTEKLEPVRWGDADAEIPAADTSTEDAE